MSEQAREEKDARTIQVSGFEKDKEEGEDAAADDDKEIGLQAMKPWEQHSAVISIPRFNYNAPLSLLQNTNSGFLITCPIKREKSATKEAISILEKFFSSFDGCSSECLENSDGLVTTKKQKVCPGMIKEKCVINAETKSYIEDHAGKLAENTNKEGTCPLSLVKLTRSGLLLFTCDSSYDVVNIITNVTSSLKSGGLKKPTWCHRILPIQATCILNEKELHTTVSKLVAQFVDSNSQLARPVKFAVGFNRRGIEETEMKDRKTTSSGLDSMSENILLLDRRRCFAIAAAAVTDAISDSVVDLKCPELSVLIELLPVSGVPCGKAIVAVSILPCDLVSTKPRLGVKALISETKTRNGGIV